MALYESLLASVVSKISSYPLRLKAEADGEDQKRHSAASVDVTIHLFTLEEWPKDASTNWLELTSDSDMHGISQLEIRAFGGALIYL